MRGGASSSYGRATKLVGGLGLGTWGFLGVPELGLGVRVSISLERAFDHQNRP